jgi:hypothetical protein
MMSRKVNGFTIPTEHNLDRSTSISRTDEAVTDVFKMRLETYKAVNMQ